MKKSWVIIVVAVVAVGIILFNHFRPGNVNSGKAYGKTIPADIPTTAIVEVLENTAKYSQEEVVIEGKIVMICPAGGWFYLQDETGQIYVNNHPTDIYITPRTGIEAKVIGKIYGNKNRSEFVGSGVLVK